MTRYFAHKIGLLIFYIQFHQHFYTKADNIHSLLEAGADANKVANCNKEVEGNLLLMNNYQYVK